MSSILKEMRTAAMQTQDKPVADLLRSLANELVADMRRAFETFDADDMRRVNATWARAAAVLKIAKGPAKPPGPLAPSVSVEQERKAA